ncbi:MAG: hypothetical protein HUU57_02175 [Bdellovibrio sp.]|nr:hypothetical protein [Bdellovibrio sp.]
MKKLICSIGLLFTLPALASTVSVEVFNKPSLSHIPQLTTKSTSVDYNTGSSMMFGRGYDSLSDDSAGKCVVLNRTEYDTSRTPDSVQESVFKFELIESRYDLAKKIGVSAAASLKSGFNKGSASVSYLNEQSLNSYSIYILVSAEVLTPIEHAMDEDLDLHFVDLARSHPKAFRQKCGNEYVAAIQRGGMLYALLKLDTVDSYSYTQIKSSLRAKVGTFKAAVDLERSIAEATSNKSLQIFVHQVGGEAKTYPTSVAELIGRVKDFSLEVTKRPTPLRAITTAYSHLKSYPIEATEFDTAVQEGVFEYLNQLKFKLTDHRDNVNYILNNKSQFIAPNLKELQGRIDYVNQKLNEINTLTRTCLNNFEKCLYPENFKYQEYNLPERLEKAFADNQCKIRTHLSCGAIYKVARGPECGVGAYKLAAHPKCGAKTFNLSRSAACPVAAYNTGRGPACGVARYNQRKNGEVCGTDDRGDCMRSLPIKVAGVFPVIPKRGSACFSTPRTCRHPSFGVEAYNSCSDASFGVQAFQECRDPSHGVESFNSCRDPEFGVEEYATCEHPTHEVVAIKQCKLLEFFDLESGVVKYKECKD